MSEITDTERLEWLIMGKGRDGFRIESDHEGCYVYHFKNTLTQKRILWMKMVNNGMAIILTTKQQ